MGIVRRRMFRSLATAALAALTGLALGGCAGAPPYVQGPHPLATDPPSGPYPQNAAPMAPAAAAPGATSAPTRPPHHAQAPSGCRTAAPAGIQAGLSTTAPRQTATPSPQDLQAILAELRQWGDLDPNAQQILIEDLQKTDPALWGPIMRNFRVALAYRRRMEALGRGGLQQPGQHEQPAEDGGEGAGETEPGDPQGEDDGHGAAKGQPKPDQDKRIPRPPPPGSRREDFGTRTPSSPSRAAGNEAALSHPPADSGSPPEPRRDAVVPARHDVQVEVAWHDQLAAAIAGLEAEVSPAPKTDAEIAAHVHLRLLYMAAGQRNEAMKPIPGVPPGMQEFWSTQVYALGTLLDAERTPDRRSRAAEAKRLLAEAVSKLSVAAPLTVKGLAFCTEVQSFGCYTEFGSNEFLPGQEVLLYVEVENFHSQPTPRGYQTSLHGSYKIFDARGQQVAKQDFPATEEICRNQRHDFFIPYYLSLPKELYPGRHTLKLTIEDLNRREVAQGSVDFVVKPRAN